MGIFSKLFEKLRVKIVGGFFGYQSQSSPWDRDAWMHDTFRATVDAIATHAAKGKVKAVVMKNGRIVKEIHNDRMAYLLNERPNEVMSAFELKYRLVAALETKTTAIAYIDWDGVRPRAIYPVDYQQFEFRAIKGGGIAVEFVDYEGVERALPLEECVILRKFYCDRLASGDGNTPVYKVLSMSQASDEGFVEALHVSNKIRGIWKSKRAMLDPDDVRKNQEAFAERMQKAAEKGGIVGIDATEEYTPLNITAYTSNAAQMKEINNRIYTYLRTSEKIVQNNYTEQEGMAWYEGKIEPIWEMMAEAFSNAYFTEREKEVGNRLIVSGGIMMGTSIDTRVKVLDATKEAGELTTNERRELLGYPPVADGDVRQVSLNYVKAQDQGKYQIGSEAKQEPEKEGEEGEDGNGSKT